MIGGSMALQPIFWLSMLITHHGIQAAFPNYYPQLKTVESKGNPGLPLILTPLIEQNKIVEARKAALNYLNDFKGIKSFSGYFTNDYKHAPVVLWLQGGPGASSLIGLFAENGPVQVKNDKLVPRKYAWSQTHSIIYIDSPVGTGYSFTDGGYCQNETAVGEQLYRALYQFFIMFPELINNDFFVAGESYGGKYVPAVAYAIHLENKAAKLKINLQGISIGNGFIDPEYQVNYADYLYQLGFIDDIIRSKMHQIQNQGLDYVKNKEWLKAFLLFDSLIDGDSTTNHSSLFKNVTGFDSYYNYLYPSEPSDSFDFISNYIQRDDVRAAIHVGNVTFHAEAPLVEINLVEDIFQSVSHWLSKLLDHYRVLLYNGQLDIIVAYPLTENFLQNFQFSASDSYKNATRYQWMVGKDIAGYVKQAGNLTEIMVRDAGHMVPMDQPKWAFDLINRFTRNKRFH